MKEKVVNPHDRFFKATMTDLKIAKDYFRRFVSPKLVNKLQLDKLEIKATNFVNKALSEHFVDIAYACPYIKNEVVKEVHIILLLEHKSYVPDYPHYQLLLYIGAVWAECIKNKEPLKLVLPFIFYHGKETWEVKDFFEYFGDIDEEFRQYIPQFNYILTDTADFSDADMLAMNTSFLMNTILIFKYGKNANYIRNNYQMLFMLPEGEGVWNDYTRNFFHTFFVYLLNVANLKKEEMNTIIKELPKPIKQIGMTTYDYIRLEGEEIGVKKGKTEGKIEGKEEEQENIVIKLFKKDFSISFIANMLEISEAKVKAILVKHGLIEGE